MNNNNNSNYNDNNDIDDILDILQKRKLQDSVNGASHNSSSMVDNTAAAPKAAQNDSVVSAFSLSVVGFGENVPSNHTSAEQKMGKSTTNHVSDESNSTNNEQQKSIQQEITKEKDSQAQNEATAKESENSAKLSAATPQSLPPIKATPVVPAAPLNNDAPPAPVRTDISNSATKQVPISVRNEKPVYTDRKPPSNVAKPINDNVSSSVSGNKDYNASDDGGYDKHYPPSSMGRHASVNSHKKAFGNVQNSDSHKKSDISSRSANGANSSTIRTGQGTSAKNTPANDGRVNLNDFDSRTTSKSAKKSKIKSAKKGRFPGWAKVLIYLFSVLSISVIISLTVIKVSNDVFAFVKDDKEVAINITEKDTLKTVAQKLEKADIIEYPWIFEQFTKYKMSKNSYLTDNFISGKHILNPSMNYDSIILALCVPAVDKTVVRITIPEGYEFNEIIDLFVENGVIQKKNKDDFIKQVEEFDYEYNFITKLDEQHTFDNENRHYHFEGYLFPDTYEFYKNESPVAAIDKLLQNFDNKFTDEMYEKANELGLTVDEVIIIASMIEAEGDSAENFSLISSVFHNRLNSTSGDFKFLGSDATTLYAYRISGFDKKTLSKGETSFDHPYNTYTNIGLPPGPICNPGIKAINAALNPANTNYYFFLTMANGETVFARTLSEHEANIRKSDRLAAEIAAQSQE